MHQIQWERSKALLGDASDPRGTVKSAIGECVRSEGNSRYGKDMGTENKHNDASEKHKDTRRHTYPSGPWAEMHL